MADFYADAQGVINGPTFGQPLQNRMSTRKLHGRIRIAEFMFIAPSSGTAPAIADRIIWGKLPIRSRLLGFDSRLQWGTGTASCTLNLGDHIVPARYLAATAITTASTATPTAADFVQASVADTTINSATLTNVRSIGAYTVGAIVSGTGIATASKVVGVDYVSRTVQLSLACTASGTGIAITVTGCSYEAVEDSLSLANSFTQTVPTDDCTLISVVAGAQIANNQAILLKAAYAHD